MKQTFFRLRTTYTGADGPSETYYDTAEKAQATLATLDNGEIEKVTFEADYKLNYWDGCSYDTLTGGNWDAEVVSVE